MVRFSVLTKQNGYLKAKMMTKLVLYAVGHITIDRLYCCFVHFNRSQCFSKYCSELVCRQCSLLRRQYFCAMVKGRHYKALWWEGGNNRERLKEGGWVTHTAGWNVAGHRRESCSAFLCTKAHCRRAAEGGVDQCLLMTAMGLDHGCIMNCKPSKSP